MSYEQPIEDAVREEKEERAAYAYGKTAVAHMRTIRKALAHRMKALAEKGESTSEECMEYFDALAALDDTASELKLCD